MPAQHWVIDANFHKFLYNFILVYIAGVGVGVAPRALTLRNHRWFFSHITDWLVQMWDNYCWWYIAFEWDIFGCIAVSLIGGTVAESWFGELFRVRLFRADEMLLVVGKFMSFLLFSGVTYVICQVLYDCCCVGVNFRVHLCWEIDCRKVTLICHTIFIRSSLHYVIFFYYLQLL